MKKFDENRCAQFASIVVASVNKRFLLFKTLLSILTSAPQIWKDAHRYKQQSPYLSHMLPSHSIQSCRFAPFEDVLGIGHSGGFSSILVPGERTAGGKS